ncbi:MAG: glycosyltransferase family 4 protein [Myxococcaceae bacterium]
MRVHQLIPTFTPGDAMGQCAVTWQRALRHLGFSGQLFAGEVAPQWHSLVRPLSELRTRPDDLVLYHHGIASSLAGRVMHLPCRRGVVFHNVTPARFYEGSRLAEPLIAGRAQLAALADFVELSIGVSDFNARELREAGHRNVHVVPLSVEAERFAAGKGDGKLDAKLASAGRPRVVSVSRVVPHKRMEDLVSLHEELRRIAPRAELWLVGGFAAGSAAFKALEARADAAGGVRFLGRVSHAELVSAYRAADVFVSMSEHEGFGVPLIEAMAAEVPVLAFGAAAVPETMGGRGIVFDEKNFAALAEVVKRLGDDAELRARVVAGQGERLAQLRFEDTTAALGRALGAGASKPTRPGRKRRRVAVVVQRFGEDINGGAEAHARQVALRLADHADVEVLTTCATDHLSWANVLEPGVSRDGPLTVHRFQVRAPRQMRPFNALSRQVFDRSLDFVTETHWLAEQGPDSPWLLDAVAARRDDFDAFLFFTYLYGPTAWGVPLVADKALVVPTAHDEPPLRFGALRDVFEKPRVLMTNTPEESQLIARQFPNVVRQRVTGVGITPRVGKPQRFRDQWGLSGPYLLYLGRLEAGKGVLDLLRRHSELVDAFHDAPHLVLVGGGDLKPQGARLVTTGRVDEQAKWDALAGAMAVVVPSQYESLSLVTLEAFAVGTPVIGNVKSDVVKGQLERSGGGLPFDLGSATDFQRAVREVGERRDELGKRAKKYAARYDWDTVVRAYLEEIDALSGGRKS